MRLWVRFSPKMGPSQPWGDWFSQQETHHLRFQGPAEAHGTPPNCGALRQPFDTSALSLCEWLPGPRRLNQKRKLLPKPPPVSASFFPLPGSCNSNTVQDQSVWTFRV